MNYCAASTATDSQHLRWRQPVQRIARMDAAAANKKKEYGDSHEGRLPFLLLLWPNGFFGESLRTMLQGKADTVQGGLTFPGYKFTSPAG